MPRPARFAKMTPLWAWLSLCCLAACSSAPPGQPSLEVVQGQALLRGGAYGYATVLALDDFGVTTLWPTEGSALGRLDAGRATAVGAVEAGKPVRLIALLAKEPRPLARVSTPLVSEVVRRSQRGQPLREVEVPDGLADAVLSLETGPQAGGAGSAHTDSSKKPADGTPSP